MTLRSRTVRIVGLTFLCLIAVLSAASRLVLGREFSRLEEQHVRDNLQRASNALSDETASLAAIADDWAAWDDTYAFILDRDAAYVRSNLVDDTFLTLRLNAMVFLDAGGNIVYAGGFDLREERPVALPRELAERLVPGSSLLDHPDPSRGVQGILIARDTALLLASQPITTSSREGPIRGTLVMARRFDADEVTRLASLTRLSLAVYFPDDPRAGEDAPRAREALEGGADGFVSPLSAETIAAYALVPDLDGGTALLLRCDEPRTIRRQGNLSLLIFLVSLLVCALVVGAVVLTLLSRAVLSPLATLSREVSRIGEAGRVSVRVATSHRDELGILAGSINGMLEALARSEVEQEQLRMQLAQVQKMEAIGTLAGGVAHDFNNILTAIIGYSDYLLMKMDSGGPFHAAVGQIKKAGERAASLTNQLLAFSRRQMLQPRVLDLNDVVSDTAAMLKRLIGEDIELVSRLATDRCGVKVDPGQIQQVMLNLAVNARDAMPGGGTLVIATGCVTADQAFIQERPGLQPGDYVRLSMSDTGCGMDAAVRARIFEPFFTTKEMGKGTGLGLSVVFGIVKQSGGCIYVSSVVGSGSTFEIFLPLAGERIEEPVPPRPHERRTCGNEMLLVAEDDPLVRRFVVTSLTQLGYRVVEAAEGAEALNVAAAVVEGLHLLLTDVVMPVMGGVELAERLAKVRPGLKVLYMSGYSDRITDAAAMPGGGAIFLEKPFDTDTLARKVRETLRG